MQPARFKVRDQRRGGAVAVRAQLAVPLVVVGVGVPGLVVRTHIIDRHKAHAGLDQTARQEARTRERRVAIGSANGLRLAADVEGFHRLALHVEGGFHRLDLAFKFGIAIALGEVETV